MIKRGQRLKCDVFSVFIFPPSSIYPLGFDEFSTLRINTNVWVSTGEEKGAQMWRAFWQNRFHGCFMLHRPLVFCLALALHNVNLKQGGFGVGVLI